GALPYPPALDRRSSHSAGVDRHPAGAVPLPRPLPVARAAPAHQGGAARRRLLRPPGRREPRGRRAGRHPAVDLRRVALLRPRPRLQRGDHLGGGPPPLRRAAASHQAHRPALPDAAQEGPSRHPRRPAGELSVHAARSGRRGVGHADQAVLPHRPPRWAARHRRGDGGRLRAGRGLQGGWTVAGGVRRSDARRPARGRRSRPQEARCRRV
ncbi:MAG: hypothetical protein AVDCRST_MAG50-598, partial [uncultured Acidimicrobiales bacterium]